MKPTAALTESGMPAHAPGAKTPPLIANGAAEQYGRAHCATEPSAL